MKLRNIILGAAVCGLAMTSCTEEKQHIIIEGNLPIKTSTLFMVGNAAPCGWNIGAPTALTQSEADPLVFYYKGEMNTGEIKLCLTPGSWDAPFIRPLVAGEEIGEAPITDRGFQMHAGDPDEKWVFTKYGNYELTFDLRNWTFSSTYLGVEEKPVDPVLVSEFYLIGNAVPTGWDNNNPTPTTKISDYVFEYVGNLYADEFKAMEEKGSWDATFMHPRNENCDITMDGAAFAGMNWYAGGNDTKWVVVDPGKYKLTFDLFKMEMTAEYLGVLDPVEEPEPDPNEGIVPETNTLYLIGNSTPGGWSMDDLTAMTQDSSNPRIFSWTGALTAGELKACIAPDGTYGCPFLRPSYANCAINSNGVAAPECVYTAGDPDDKWLVEDAGTYTITFDLDNMTISVVAE